jgi:hypothetical protein
VSYELLNRIRIAEVKVDKDQITVRGDATAAYLPGLGLKQFVREFVFKPNSGFVITDAIETAAPAALTLLFHADEKFEKGDKEFMIATRAVKLLIDASIAEPKSLGELKTVIQPNDLTAPGPPGAVDKGAQQIRGQKLLLIIGPTTKARLIERLKIEGL